MNLTYKKWIGLAVGVVALAQSPQRADTKFKAIWEPVNVKEDLELTSAAFVGPEEGWVAGGKTEVAGGVILHTKDGGVNWEVQLGDPQSSERAYRQLQFLNAALGWAVQATGTGDHKLLQTDGQGWKETGTVAQHRGDYRFTSAQTGFVTTREGIKRTMDGGRHWQVIYPCRMNAEVQGLTRNLNCEFAKLFFLNERQGWALSNAGAKDAGFVVARTRDGGETWESWVALPGEDPREGSIYFTDENHGTLLTGGKFFSTVDSGKTWTGATGQAPGKPAIQFADGRVGWAMHYRDMSYTVDSGQHWISREIAFPAMVEGFTIVRPDRGYAVGAHGMVYRYRVVATDYTSKGMIAAPSMAAK